MKIIAVKVPVSTKAFEKKKPEKIQA